MTNPDRNVLRWVLACLCAGGFLLMLALVVTDHAGPFDDPIRNAFYALRREGLTAIVLVVTNAANKYFIIALCLILLILPQTRIPFGVPLSAGALGTILLNTGIKHLVQRQRPDDILHLATEPGYSFASGHSVCSMFFYGMAIWLVWHYLCRPTPDGAPTLNNGSQRLASGTAPTDPDTARHFLASRPLPLYSKRTAVILTVLLALPLFFVGPTRIYLGVHFPTDVLAGWCLAGFAIFIEAEILLAVERRRSRK